MPNLQWIYDVQTTEEVIERLTSFLVWAVKEISLHIDAEQYQRLMKELSEMGPNDDR